MLAATLHCILSEGEIPGTPGTLATTFLAFVLNLAFALSVLGFLLCIYPWWLQIPQLLRHMRRKLPKWRYDLVGKRILKQVGSLQ
ncbi:hypothetical protein M0R45_034711 [Rubus argutus]|uniref:Uncharacterized protein n=1 Tax=Rubus argutus TaxID=59490 RepID=A0AAW1VWC5_RUBAR